MVAIPDPQQRHAIDRYWCVAEALGVGDTSKRFDVPVRAESRAWVQQQMKDLPRPWLAFGVGARWLTKRWPPDSFAELARRAQERFGGTAFFVGAPDEAPLAKQVIAQLRGPSRDFVGTTSLQQLAGLLEAADVMVANDTGPLAPGRRPRPAVRGPVYLHPGPPARALRAGRRRRDRRLVQGVLRPHLRPARVHDRTDARSPLARPRVYPLRMGIPLPFRLTLASGSQGRRYLLERAGYTFDVKPSNVPEPTEAVGGNIRDYVMHVAWTKAAAVGPTVADGVVLAADSVGWIDGHVIGKPEDEADARRILQTLSGRVHELWTGVCLWRAADGWQLQWQEVSRVRMKELSAGEIDAVPEDPQVGGLLRGVCHSGGGRPVLDRGRGVGVKRDRPADGEPGPRRSPSWRANCVSCRHTHPPATTGHSCNDTCNDRAMT